MKLLPDTIRSDSNRGVILVDASESEDLHAPVPVVIDEFLVGDVVRRNLRSERDEVRSSDEPSLSDAIRSNLDLFASVVSQFGQWNGGSLELLRLDDLETVVEKATGGAFCRCLHQRQQHNYETGCTASKVSGGGFGKGDQFDMSTSRCKCEYYAMGDR